MRNGLFIINCYLLQYASQNNLSAIKMRATKTSKSPAKKILDKRFFSDRQREKIQESLRADSSLESKNGRDEAQIHKGKEGQPSLLSLTIFVCVLLSSKG